MNELTKNWIREFQDKETRHIYAENFLNTYVATQLKVLREDREWTQQQLAEETGMKQERISVLEDVNYESWTIKTLKRFAWAFDLVLSIKFENFGTFLKDYDSFSRDNLKRLPFDKDPAFHPESAPQAIMLRSMGGTGKTYHASRMLQTLNTASGASVYGFRGDPVQAKFSFMYQPQTAISEIVSTPTLPRITVEDFIEANRDLAFAYWSSKNVEDKEAA
ncbi:MAG TPA: helix-turn-helix transcriptional regulator [Anaerolineales bacterium]|nr:helix-turn-helix transcriptional regulator [Anaerolineales bacterium]